MFAAEDSKFRRVKILARELGGLLAEAVFRVFGSALSGHIGSFVCGLPWEKLELHRSAAIGIYHTGS